MQREQILVAPQVAIWQRLTRMERMGDAISKVPTFEVPISKALTFGVPTWRVQIFQKPI